MSAYASLQFRLPGRTDRSFHDVLVVNGFVLVHWQGKRTRSCMIGHDVNVGGVVKGECNLVRERLFILVRRLISSDLSSSADRYNNALFPVNNSSIITATTSCTALFSIPAIAPSDIFIHRPSPCLIETRTTMSQGPRVLQTPRPTIRTTRRTSRRETPTWLHWRAIRLQVLLAAMEETIAWDKITS